MAIRWMTCPRIAWAYQSVNWRHHGNSWNFRRIHATLLGVQKYPMTDSLNDLRQQKQASLQENWDGCCNEFHLAFRKMLWFHYQWREGTAWTSVWDDEKLYTHQNWKEKLNSLGIWKQQEQKVFLDIAIKEGVLVAEHKTDLKARIHSSKQILEDEEKRISSTSSPQLWTNISSHKTSYSHIFTCFLVMSDLRK